MKERVKEREGERENRKDSKLSLTLSLIFICELVDLNYLYVCRSQNIKK